MSSVQKRKKQASGSEVMNEAFAETLHLIQEEIGKEHESDDYQEILETKPEFYDRKAEDIGVLLPRGADFSRIKNLTDFKQWVFGPNQPDWRRIGFGGWSDFSAGGCASETVGDEHWQDGLKQLIDNYFRWQLANAPKDYSRAANAMFDGVKYSSALLFGKMNELLKLLAISSSFDNTATGNLKAIGAIEKNRKNSIEKLKADSKDMDKAIAHYVGYGTSMFFLAIVSLMCGWVLWRVRTFIGLDMTTLFPLFGSFVVGGVISVVVLNTLHSWRGKIGVKNIIRQSEELDNMMVNRDELARTILIEGKEMRDQLQLRSVRFRIWALLQRIQTILLTELQPRSSEIDDLFCKNDDAQSADEDDNDRDVQFKRFTRNIIGPFKITNGAKMHNDIMAVVREWMLGEGYTGTLGNYENFKSLWKRLCLVDKECNGYFPAKLFINELGFFVRRFMDGLMHVIDDNVMQNHMNEIRNRLEDWCGDIQWMQFAYFATGAIKGEYINEEIQTPGFVYVDGDNPSVNIVGLREVLPLDFTIRSSSLLSQVGMLAFLYQEYCVDFRIYKSVDKNGEKDAGETSCNGDNAKDGILILREVSNVQ